MKQEKLSYCRICEPLCGMIATVEDGRLTGLRADKDDPHSKGFCCTKGVAMVQIVNDPDRLTVPMRRVGGPGEFEPTTWEQALGDIAGRLGRLRSRYGPSSIAVHEGNPPNFSYSAVLWAKGFQKAVGTPWFYGINSEDAAARFAANKILYGHCAHPPIPDFRRAGAAMILGANPWLSKGSVVTDPRLREHILGIRERGGRIFVVDPRLTETAKTFEHIPIRAGTDAWFLLSVCSVLVTEELYDRDFVERWTRGFEHWHDLLARHTPETTAEHTGLPPELVYDIARTLAAADSAVVYGRTGTCTQRFGTLTNILQDLVCILTGNLQRPGGWVWGWSPNEIGPISERLKMASFGAVHTRVAGLPDSFGFLPSSALPDEITVPGAGRIRAMVMIGSNCVITGPAGDRLAGALEQLDTFVSLDLYLNETNRHAHYLLPCTSMYEREDVPILFSNRYQRPAMRVTEPVVDPLGECRQEWEILDDIARRMGLGGAYTSGLLRRLAKLGIRLGPRRMADLIVRTGKGGDWFGLRRRGWSWKKLRSRAPHGVVLHEYLPLAPLKKMIRTTTGKIELGDPRILHELDRLDHHASDVSRYADYPLRLVTLREVKSHNSWMHNSARLMPDSRRHTARIHPDDGERYGLTHGGEATITSAGGSITIGVNYTRDVTPGTLAVPHGWGHQGSWQRANAAGGMNSNLLSHEIENLSGTTVLNAIPVRIEPLDS